MIPMTLGEVARVVGGELVGGRADAVVRAGAEFDSRKVQPGGLFVAFVGANVDGHEFGGKAIADGAVAVLGSRAVPDVPTIVVEDPRGALGRLARAVVD